MLWFQHNVNNELQVCSEKLMQSLHDERDLFPSVGGETGSSVC